MHGTDLSLFLISKLLIVFIVWFRLFLARYYQRSRLRRTNSFGRR